MAFRLDRAPLVDFCNQHSPRARPQDRPSPVSRWNERALAHVARRLRSRSAAGCAGVIDQGVFSLDFARRQQPPPRERVAPSRRSPPTLALAGTWPLRAVETYRTGMSPSGCAGGHQPRFHGSGAGMLWCQRPLVRSDARTVARTQPSAHGCPCAVTLTGDCGETSIPARSARTPLVVRPGHRRVENPAAPGVAPVREQRPRRSHQGPHHPRFREEERDPPHPRCLPSVKPATGELDEALASTRPDDRR